MAENLWGELPTVAKQTTPRDILAEQAAVLNGAMGGKIQAGIVHRADGSRLRCEMSLIVPTLNNYEVEILSIVYSPSSMYPVMVYGDTGAYEASDEAGYKKIIAEILQSPRVRHIVSGLLAHAKF